MQGRRSEGRAQGGNVDVRAGTKLEGGVTPPQSWNGRANHLDWQGNERF